MAEMNFRHGQNLGAEDLKQLGGSGGLGKGEGRDFGVDNVPVDSDH